MPSKIFVNFPVKDLDKSIAFFTKLGFTFNPKFTNQQATCMILGENIFAMLLVEPFFKTFIKKSISDATRSTEVITALAVDSKEQVNDIVDKALVVGGKVSNETSDQGGMYTRSFQDLDGHLWEICYMDPNTTPQ